MNSRGDANPARILGEQGPQALSNEQLLALILSPSKILSPRAASWGTELIDRFGNPSRLDRASLVEICSVGGLGKLRASKIKAALELGRRSLSALADRPRLVNSRDVADYFIPRLGNKEVEHFCCALLDSRNRLIRDSLVATGTVNACFIHPREVYRAAVTESACAVILVHNHPSGELKPSDEDVSLTRRITDAGSILGIRVLDHVIIGPGGYFSFLDSGLMQA